MDFMNESKCLDDEWIEMDDAGGRLRGATEGLCDTGEAGMRGCCSVDSADKNRLTCFLFHQQCCEKGNDLLLMQVPATSLVNLAIPKVSLAQHFKYRQKYCPQNHL
jgi:hypothetical protein